MIQDMQQTDISNKVTLKTMPSKTALQESMEELLANG